MIEERYDRNETLRALAVMLAIAASVLLGFAAIARADTGAARADTGAAHAVTGSPDDLANVLTTYGPVVGGMYLAYAIAAALLARYAGSSWLAQGKRLAIATGMLGVAGAALQTRLTGASWTVVLAAAVAAAFKLLTPTVTPVATAGAGPAKLASVAVIALAIGGLALGGMTATGCGGNQSSRAQTIVSIDKAISTAEGALAAYDHERAKAIIDAVPSPATADQVAKARAEIAAHRAKVDKVQLALDAARVADDAARTLNDDPSLKGAQDALANAIAAVTALTGGKTP